MIRLHVITPITTGPPRAPAEFGALLDQNVAFSAELLSHGPDSIECEADEACALPEILKHARAAEAAGVDAILIDCFGDPGLAEARHEVSVPVFGPGEASMHLAAMLGARFAIVTVLESVFGMIERQAEHYGVSNRMAPLRCVNIPVLELESDAERLERALAREALAAVRTDGADVIILGCTGMLGAADALAKTLRRETAVTIPVIDPLPAAAAIALGWARMRAT